MITIYHKPNCNTSNRALAYLRESGKKFRIIHYLEAVPTPDEIASLLQKLGIAAEDLVRKKEPLFREKFSRKKYSEQEWIDILHQNPVLIERPVLVKRTRAIIARPPEILLKWI
jgi:arsenate reductase (glutaredoxin)